MDLWKTTHLESTMTGIVRRMSYPRDFCAPDLNPACSFSSGHLRLDRLGCPCRVISRPARVESVCVGGGWPGCLLLESLWCAPIADAVLLVAYTEWHIGLDALCVVCRSTLDRNMCRALRSHTHVLVVTE